MAHLWMEVLNTGQGRAGIASVLDRDLDKVLPCVPQPSIRIHAPA